jgi:flagellar motility protein MotE (MotC chaperone)
MEKTSEEKERTRYSPFQWFIYIILIPLLFTITVALVVMTFSGINVFEAAKEYGNKIPLVGSLFAVDKKENNQQLEKNIIDLESQIKDREAKIQQLKTQMDQKDKSIQMGELEKSKLQQEVNNLVAIQEENKRAFKDIVRTYETMPVKKSAPIISKMPETEALKILSNIKPETLAGIMENMDPAQAAKFTGMLTTQDQTDSQNQ